MLVTPFVGIIVTFHYIPNEHYSTIYKSFWGKVLGHKHTHKQTDRNPNLYERFLIFFKFKLQEMKRKGGIIFFCRQYFLAEKNKMMNQLRYLHHLSTFIENYSHSFEHV